MKRSNQLNKISLSFLMVASILILAIFAMQSDSITGVKKKGLDRNRIDVSGSPLTFYVSPSGNDASNGSLNYPFHTITRAQQAVRANTTSMTRDIVVYLRGGTYPVSSTIIFNSSDGGSGPFKVFYEAYPGEMPVIDGGLPIPSSAWQLHDASKNIWRVQPGVADFRQLYIIRNSGAPQNTNDPYAATIPAYPYAGAPTPLSVTSPSYDGSGQWERRAQRAFGIEPTGTFKITGDGHDYLTKSGFWSDLSKWSLPFGGTIGDNATTEQYAQDMEFVYHLSWNIPRIHPYWIGMFQGRNTIIMQEPAFFLARTKGGTQLGASWPGTGQPDWIENAYALLDKGGEWYFDRHTGWLFYKPLASELAPNSTSIKFIVPSTETLLSITGVAGHPVSNLAFSNITFKHASWLRPNAYGLGFVDVQANYILGYSAGAVTTERSPGAVQVTYGNNILFDRCTFTKFGGAGIDLYIGTQNSTIRGCSFNDMSGTGVNIGDINAYNANGTRILDNDPRISKNDSVIDCVFTNICTEFKGGHAIFAGYVQDARIEHNYIIGTAYTAISVGWGWSYALTFCHNNSIRYNHICNYMMEMQDGAAIYTLSLQNNTHVEHNHIHDGAGSGLYPDEQTAQTYWRYNVVYRSGNSLQDHSLGEARNGTSIRENVIDHNYLDMDPIIEPARQQSHIPTNTWRIGVDNDPDAKPNDTVMANVLDAGLESAYQDLNSNLEQVHKKTQKGLYWIDMLVTSLPFGDNVAFFWACIAGMAAVAFAGVVMVARKGGLLAGPSRTTSRGANQL